MYESILCIGDKKYKGILDFYVMRKVQEYLKENGFNFTIQEIFKSLSDIENLNMHSVCSLTVNSISRAMNLDEDTIAEEIMNIDINEEERFKNIFEFLNSLIKKCMPTSDSNEDSIFDDDLDFIDDTKSDWDFYFMEYTWATILKRSDDFYKSTPKNFFCQVEIHNKLTGVQQENIECI